ncbi:N-acetylglucosaminyldiphosphodolichol N-acetylglucosaminyltransferase anchoring subunit ALG14 PWA37_003784 [Arxiozyma heterogenica]|uniref:UDP-N-acetylglucosamine transferase subunit ALG14 n=1 Tax=Arxiozyma heterogenica TaxID=278026 RepID=A0AAN7ZWW2_9SACH|nr:hypothetical protein RI543_004924 [Kazachstania heterogenica]
MDSTAAVSLLLFIITIYIFRLIIILPCCHDFNYDYDKVNNANKTTGRKKNIINEIQNKGMKNLHLFIFLGSGGHTGEMLRLLLQYKDILLNKDTILHVGYSDIESLNKIKHLSGSFNCKINYYRFQKAREVNANFTSSFKTIFITMLTSFLHIAKIKYQMLNNPHLVLLNGPGTCFIITVWFKLLDLILLATSSNIVYIESLARINTFSLTGKLLYWIVDELIVQWPELQAKYPKAKYFGILV